MAGKRTPPKLKVLLGNAGKRRPRTLLAAPMTLTEVPSVPEAIRSLPVAVETWERVLADLIDRQLIIKLDLMLLTVYCVEVALYAELCEKIAGMGYTVPTERGGVKTNPCIAMRNQAARNVAKLGAEFGLSPLSRLALVGSAVAAPANDREAKYFDNGA